MSHYKNDNGIAVIGYAGRFPGADNCEYYWQNIVQKRDCVKILPIIETVSKQNWVYATAMLSQIDCFDAGFFDVSPLEAKAMVPQLRVSLENVYNAVAHAGYPAFAIQACVGVFVGSSYPSYLINQVSHHQALIGTLGIDQLMIANDCGYLATHLFYKFGFTGPSVTLDTACSTSLVAVHCGCQSLLTFECDMAVVGGISIHGDYRHGYAHTEGSMLSPDGHCRPFAEDANGTIFGCWVGHVILKRLEDAQQDQDAIYGVITGSAINNDGDRKSSYTAPSVEGQVEVIQMAQQLADLQPQEIQYIEAHGTGTKLGDPLEIDALNQVFAQLDDGDHVALGSVKGNIGHLTTTAGIAGLIKTIKALENQLLPASINAPQLNPYINFTASPFYLNRNN